MIRKIVSGGQTGVDRAALDVALARGLAIGGWCPRGRRAQDGRVPDRYPLIETPSPQYPQRTEWNVRDADATLVLTRGAVEGGTAFTLRMARKWNKPCRLVDLAAADVDGVLAWLHETDPAILNIAGPREETRPGIQREAAALLDIILTKARLRP